MRTETLTEPVARRAVNPSLVLALVCLAQFMVVLDATIVNVALPTLQHDLHFSPSSLQWVINSYTLVFGGFLLLGGRASDLFGRKRLFLAGLVVFTAASVLDGIAPSSGFLIAARALQGFGAALVSPAALSIVTTTFPEGRERTRAMGVLGGDRRRWRGGRPAARRDPDRVRVVALDLLHQRPGRSRSRSRSRPASCPSRASRSVVDSISSARSA